MIRACVVPLLYLGLLPWGIVSCVSVDCHTHNSSDSFIRNVPAAPGYVPPGDAATLPAGGKVRTLTYSIDPDGTFTFYRSVETEVGFLGAEVESLGRKAAKEIGIEPYDGVEVRSVSKNGPAAEAGVRSGDVLLKFDEKSGLSPDRLRYLIESSSPGQKVALDIRRGGEAFKLVAELGSQKQIESGNVFQAKLNVLNDLDRSGLRLVELTDETRPAVLGPNAAHGGVVVIDVLPGGPAFHAGVLVRDVITHAAGQPIATLADYERAAGPLERGGRAAFSVWRSGARTDAEVKLETNATGEGGVHIPFVFTYKHKPQNREVEVLMGLLYNYERCYSVRERKDQPENYGSMGWGALVNLIAYTSNSRGKGKLSLLWLIPIWWGDD